MSDMRKTPDLKYQMEVMGVIGYAVYWCQLVETVIAKCLLLTAECNVDENGEKCFDIWDPEEKAIANTSKPLGPLLRTYKLDKWFISPVRKRLTRFVRRRNSLIHHCFRGRISIGRRSDLAKIHRLATKILKDAFYFLELFDAFYGMQVELTIFPKLPPAKAKRVLKIIDAKQARGDYARLFRILKVPRT
jgi:hypothetical protein